MMDEELRRRNLQNENLEIRISYRCAINGDLMAVSAAAEAIQEAYFPKQNNFQRQITNRNSELAEKIIAALSKTENTNPIFVVGAAHFSGENGLLETLGRKGISVKRITEKPSR
jgi:uncharacterized protein YbaP (TraB family)